jgi:hypothetical protein
MFSSLCKKALSWSVSNWKFLAAHASVFKHKMQSSGTSVNIKIPFKHVFATWTGISCEEGLDLVV